MKNFTTICTILLIISQSNAQVNVDSISTYEKAFDTYLFNHIGDSKDITDNYFSYNNSAKYEILNCNGKECKSKRKTYKSVEFKYKDITYVATNAELVNNGKTLENFDYISYKSNGNIFLEKQYTNNRISQSTFYYPDGKPLVIIKDSDDVTFYTKVVYSNNGEVISSLNMAYEAPASDDKYGKYDRLNLQISKRHENKKHIIIYGIHPDVENESIIPHDDGSLYRGYPFIGRYHNLKNYELIGYLGVANSQFFGGGTVCFLKDNNTGLNYWAVVIDNAIVYKYEAKANEIPDVQFLRNNTSIDYKSLFMINVVRPRYENSDEHSLGSLLNMKTKQLDENFTGYGINITTEETKEIGYGDKRFFEIGVYKNGKLHGAGYRLYMDIDYVKDDEGRITSLIFNLKLEAGKFENGDFVDGQKKSGVVNGEYFLNNDGSWLKPQPLENLEYSFSEKGQSPERGNFKTEDFGINLKDLKSGNRVFSTTANRVFTVSIVDTINKKIFLKSKTQNDIVFDVQKSGNLIFFQTEFTTTKKEYNCNHCKGVGHLVEKKYKTVEKSHTHETGEMSILTPTGLRRGTKKYTATWYQRELVDTRKQVCPYCKGQKTFISNSTNSSTKYIPVLF